MQKDGTLSVPDVPVVPYITGDGVGAEVTPSMQLFRKHTAANVGLNGKKCWRANALSTRQALGCRMKR